MSILRNSVITALVSGAALAAPSAAFASTASTTHTATPAASASVHRAHCTRQTFNVYHDRARFPLCYSGTGPSRAHIRDVYKVTTGRYWGCMQTLNGYEHLFRSFGPHRTIDFRPRAEISTFTLSTHPVFCPLG